jgi:hypothetical protein
MILADFAQAAEGKLNIIGGGWSITGPAPSPSAIAMLIEVPWDRTNEMHHFRLELLDSDGDPVIGAGTAGTEEPLVIEGQFEVGRPPGIKRGTPISFPTAINLPPQPLQPDGRYEWRLSINGEGDDNWRLVFSTRPAGPLPGA